MCLGVDRGGRTEKVAVADWLTRCWFWSSHGKKQLLKKTLPSGSYNIFLSYFIVLLWFWPVYSNMPLYPDVSLTERRRLQKHFPFSHFFLSFSPFRRWTPGWSDGGDRGVQVPVSKAVCGRVRLRWPRHPARHRVSHLQHLQWQCPVSSLTLNENKCMLYRLIPRLWSINLNYCRCIRAATTSQFIDLSSWLYMILNRIFLASWLLVWRNEEHKCFHCFLKFFYTKFWID